MERIFRLIWGITLALLIVLCPIRAASASVVYVNKNAPGVVHDGRSWGTAYTAVQAAINAAKSGDEVWVVRATYEGVVLPAGVALYGGFGGWENQRSQRDFRKNPTILSGQKGYTVVTAKFDGDVVDGFTIRDGNTGDDDYLMGRAGGGLNISGNAIISNNIITANRTSSNTIGAGSGGGIYVRGGAPTIANNVISGNTANGYGGAIYVYTGSPRIANNTIAGNSASLGGGLYIYGSALVVNNTIIRNSGGALYNSGGYPATGSCTTANNIIAFNDSGIQRSSGTLTLRANDVFGNDLFNFTGITDPTGADGNISADPRLSNTYIDSHLEPDSPCVDAGNDTLVFGTTDIFGKSRVTGAHVDMGCDESDGTTWPIRPAHVFRVSATGRDTNDGSAWDRAMKTINGAIANAEGGDEVWVAKGTYVENITIPIGVGLYGGFAGSEKDRAKRDFTANVTTLDGNQTGTVVSSAFYGAVIDGFTIRNGYGVYVRSGTAIISNNDITANSEGTDASGRRIGGGIFADVGSAVVHVVNNSIHGNTGGGIFVLFGTAIIADNRIAGNTSADAGGGIALVGTGSIFGNLITGNTGRRGGGIFVYGNVTIVNNTIAGNAGGSVGAGIDIEGDGTLTISNNIVALNSSGIYRYTYMYSAPPKVLLHNNDVFGNGTADYRNLPDPTGTTGNISRDPLFADEVNGNYHLLPASPCRDSGDNSFVSAGEVDLDGLPRIHGGRVDMGAYEWRAGDAWLSSLGVPITGGDAVAEGVAYIPGTDGKLYARSTEDGSAITGFPVDISAAVGAVVKLPSRPAVYYGRTGKAIYLTTDRGDVVRVLPTGTVAWHVRPLTGQTVSTPAVTPDGNVFVNLSTGSGPFNNFVFKLDEATGTPLSLSPFLGYSNAGDLGDFSPAANNRYLYVNSGWGSGQGLTLLNQDNLAVRSSFAGGEQCLSPLLLGSDLILATRGGKAYKVNAVTMNPDMGFGHFGVADIGASISAAPFADAAGNVYLGTTDGRILKWVPGSGSFQTFYTTTGKIARLTINRTAGVLGFGTSSGSFIQVPLDNPAGATTVTPGGPISTGTAYEALTDRFIVVTDTGVLSGWPSIR